jgi:hypothetical protein
MLPVSLDCPFFISPSVFSSVYSTPPLLNEIPVPSQESEWSCICVLRVLIYRERPCMCVKGIDLS